MSYLLYFNFSGTNSLNSADVQLSNKQTNKHTCILEGSIFQNESTKLVYDFSIWETLKRFDVKSICSKIEH